MLPRAKKVYRHEIIMCGVRLRDDDRSTNNQSAMTLSNPD